MSCVFQPSKKYGPHPTLEGRIDIRIINVYCHNSNRSVKTHVDSQTLSSSPTEPWSGGAKLIIIK